MPHLHGLSLAVAVYEHAYCLPIFTGRRSVAPEVQTVLAEYGTKNVHQWILNQCDHLIEVGDDVNGARFLGMMVCRFLGSSNRLRLLQYLGPLVQCIDTGGLDGLLQPWNRNVVFCSSPIGSPQDRTAVVLYRLFADALEGEGYYADAECYFRRALERGPSLAATWVSLAENLRKQNRLAEAVSLLESAHKAPQYQAPSTNSSDSYTAREDDWSADLTWARMAQQNHQDFVTIIDSFLQEMQRKLESGYVFRPHKMHRNRGRFCPPPTECS